MENSRFVSVSLSNGDFFGEMTKTNADFLVSEGMLKMDGETIEGQPIYVVFSNKDTQYLQKFYCIDNDELEF